jgi:hypothetical protein
VISRRNAKYLRLRASRGAKTIELAVKARSARP